MKILNIDIDRIGFKEALEKCLKYSRGSSKRYVVTPNPEIILSALKDAKFTSILNKADIKIPDGIGIIWAGAVSKEMKLKLPYRYNKWLMGIKHLFSIVTKNIDSYFTERVSGSDLMMGICKKVDNKTKVFLLGGASGVAKKAAINLRKKNPKLNIVGTSSGSAAKSNDATLRKAINSSKADVLFVGFGARKQEFWISRNYKYLKTVKLALGIGGSIDFAAGTSKRAPLKMRQLGIEWLWRVIKEPKRINRIINATLIFPYTFLKNLK